MAPLVTFRREGRAALTLSDSRAGERREALLSFLGTLDIPRRYLA